MRGDCLNSSGMIQLGFSGKLTVKCSEHPHKHQAETIISNFKRQKYDKRNQNNLP